PHLLANMIPEGASLEITVPYLVGSASATIQIGSQASIVAPINLSLTPAFWVAIVTTILGIAARVSQRRYKKHEEQS
ncbi:MAG: hypothetical protein ACP5PX_05355, partial [Candidatus Hadarchaeum sp.]|uniref:hypothetical protein n=1 Tax=Candidatus Hadarchaeum sp. TaxID=2883567 RepID=UPI003D0C378E